jgi:penicillin-binding protein 1A
VIQSGTGTAANYGCPAAGKTGTAENLDNAWFVGYTPQLSTAVWVGFPQGNLPMANGFGGSLAAPIWHQYMSVASNGFCGDFPPPANPWSGVQFTGPHSASGPASNTGVNPGTGNAPAGPAPNPYNNPQLFAQPSGPSGGAPGGAPTGPSHSSGAPNHGHAHGGGGGGATGGGGHKKH